LTDKRQPGRPVSADLQGRLFAAAGDLIEETGSLQEVSIDAICGRAGASKASFYRRWPDRDAFFLALIADLRMPPLADGVSPSLPADLADILQNMFGTDIRRTRIVHSALVAESRRNRDLIDRYLAHVVIPRRTALFERLRLGVAEGALPAATDIDMLAEMLTAPVLKLLLLADPDLPIPERFVERLVEEALRGRLAGRRA
jgi:AcrR family transcriptional regulator